MKSDEIGARCTGCMACLSSCPVKCISVTTDAEGFYYPKIDAQKCISCHQCEKVCHCLGQDELPPFCKSFYGKSSNEAVLKKSTSGGAFYQLAQRFAVSGGKVYGAAFDCETRSLRHTEAGQVGLDALLKSKYAESSMDDTVAKVKNDLAEGHRVLFCGTPCQAAGVRKAISNEGLLIVDFVCHGVPSAILLKEHLNDLCGADKLLNIDFRPKDKGWSGKHLRLVTTRHTTTTPYYLDAFYAGFMEYNAFLRPSCYGCRFRSAHQSDITIADFWGYREVDPAMDVQKGMSLLVANTPAGLKALQQMPDDFELHELDNKYAAYIYGTKDYSAAEPLRKQFYTLYAQHGFEYAAKKTYMKGIWKEKLKYTVKRILKRCE